MRLVRVCFIITLVATASLACAQDDFWLSRYDETNSGVSGEALNLPISLRWKHSTGDEEAIPIAMPAVGSEMIYAPVGSALYAINRTTGDLAWSQEAGDSIYSSPALIGDTLYFGSRDNSLYAVGAADGQVKWSFRAGGSIDCSPVVVGNMLYFGSDDNRLTALDLNTQQVAWQFETRGDIKATPLVYRDVVVIGSQDRHIYCLNHEGRPMWSKPVSERAFFAAPAGERTKVIYGCGKELIARDIYSGRRLWRFKTGGVITGAPCVQSRKVYIGTAAGAVYCIDANSGRGLWRYPAQGATDPVMSSPAIVDDMVVFRAGPRQLTAVSTRDGSQRWSYSLPEPPEEKAAAAAAGAGEGEIFMPEADGAMDPGGADVGGDDDGRTTTTEERRYDIEEYVDGGIAVAGDSLYVIGDDNVIYGFATAAADNVPPLLSEAILEVPGKGRTRVNFAVHTTVEDDFEGRYAEEIVIPGTPPIYLSVLVTDEGSGIDPDTIKITADGEALEDYMWDAKAGVLWYIYDPRGAAVNLNNGVTNMVFEASDWRGNRGTLRLCFTVDNTAKPPEPPQPKATGGDMMDPGMDMMPGEAEPMM